MTPMPNISNYLASAILIITISMMLQSCAPAKGNRTGHEYMPDMFHSTAYEANLLDYYSYNTWGSEEEYAKFAMPRKPVEGTIPLGYAGMKREDFDKVYPNIPENGSVPYYYEDTEEERTRAMAEITENPFPITAVGLTQGKELYDIFCAICHGEKGDGGGYLARDGSPYPAQPANFLLEEFVDATAGRYYHSIMYGKNVMGHYKDKLSYEERWQVIHYIRSLQAKELKLVYSEEENTLNTSSVPAAMMVSNTEAATDVETIMETPHQEQADH